VRPYVGELTMAFDSAEGVYRTTLVQMAAADKDEIAELPLPALKAILKAQPVPGQRKQPIAMDEQPKDFATRYPGADAIRIL